MGETYRYRAEDTLPDGTPVIVRDVTGSDRETLDQAFRRQRPESLYHRFFCAKKELSADELRYLTEVDFVGHVALAVIVPKEGGEEGIGIARYIRRPDEPRVAEVAFAVADDWQHHGVGTVLMRHLTAVAREKGVARFEAEVLADNGPMLRVFDHSGLPVHRRWSGGDALAVSLELR